MRRHLFSFGLGFGLACCVLILFVFPHYGREKFDYGFQSGEVVAKLNLLRDIPKVLGDDYKRSDGYITFFEVKDGAAVVVERNGVKTLRMYEAGP
jgi:hypothetical protein